MIFLAGAQYLGDLEAELLRFLQATTTTWSTCSPTPSLS